MYHHKAFKIAQSVPDPEPTLSETDAVLTMWQHSCAELKQAGVEMELGTLEVEGRTGLCLTLWDTDFGPKCQTFYSTKEPHTCIR